MPSSTEIKKVAVLGAGVMGAQIAAHFANAGIPSYLLDVVPPENQGPPDRSRIAREGLVRLQDLRPSPFFLPELSDLITPGNFEDDLAKISEVDWVIEAVVEKLEIKREIFKKVQEALRAGTVVSSNTSGIRISEITDGMTTGFRQHFLGTHFFNPPRYMKLLELIPTRETLPEVIERIAEFSTEVLGKSVIRSKDTPNFIANRIGTVAISYILHLMADKSYTIEEIDLLTGPLIGRPKSGTFRTLDLVGIDTFAHVSNNLFNALPHDEMRSYFKPPDFVNRLIEKKRLGEKTGGGFYKRVRREDGGTDILVLDLETLEYRPQQRPKLSSVEMARGAESLQERLGLLLAAKDKAGEFIRKTTAATLAYASNRIPEISDSILDVDCAMKWGFVWEAGPFEMWDMIGVEKFLPMIKQEGFNAAPWVEQMISAGGKSFYNNFDGRLAFNVAKGDYTPVTQDPKVIELAEVKKNSAKVVAENAGASLLDLGDHTLCLEFHTKMNAIGDDILAMAERGLKMMEGEWATLVIGNQGENFSVGANLMMLLMLAQEEEWDEIDRVIRRFQTVNQLIKYAPKPVVVAVAGRALGGGCEVALHAPIVCASAESYLGLVELSAGVIPAGGGTKEMVCRAQERGKQTKPAEAILDAFQTIAYAKVSTSGYEARKLGFLRDSASFVMNRNHLLYEAKHLALSRAKDYKPPMRPKLLAMGKSLCDSLGAGIEVVQKSGKISEYDAHLAKKLARVMAGGEAPSPTEADEQHFLDLERETFLSLCREKKTQERMQQLLKTGKPLRN